MNDTNYLILTYHKDAYFFPYLKADNITVCEPIRNKSAIMRLLFRIPFLCLISYGFFKELYKADKVIVFDSAYNKWLGLYLKHKKGKNIFLYFWNPVEKMYPSNGDMMVRNAKKLMSVFSFDHNDCKKYGVDYRPMVYSSDVSKAIKTKTVPEYDIFFLGWKKDRSKLIEKLYNDVFKAKFKCLFILVGDEDKVIDNSIIYTTHRVPYSKYLEYVLNSKAILDIPQEGQEGLTIRNVEALFLRKKLITSNKQIVEYNLYDPDNYYVLGLSNCGLNNFLQLDYKIIDDKIVDIYDFEKWVSTFEVR